MQAAVATSVPILTYHSISNGTGPIVTSPDVFARQMEEIGSSGWTVITLATCAEWLRNGAGVKPRSLVITFDDGYQDFADAAFPVLERHGFPAAVFVPTQLPGRPGAWDGAAASAPPLMSWETIKTLSDKGISFAPHSRTHADLTTLAESRLLDEVLGPKDDLKGHLGESARYFAPPYGRSSRVVRATIERGYDLSLGVRFGLAKRASPMYDLPRIEMFYYRDLRRWRDFLTGNGRAYMAARGAARFVRRLLARA